MTWFLGGGISMVFVLVFGMLAVASAGRFAWVPGEGRLAAHAAQGLAVLLAACCGVLTDLTAVAVNVSADDALTHGPDLAQILLVGFGEAMAPGVLGFALVAVQALLVAFGLRRLPTT